MLSIAIAAGRNLVICIPSIQIDLISTVRRKTAIKNQHFSKQKNIFRIFYSILIWMCEGSQGVFFLTEGFWGILMCRTIIEMVIEGSEKVKLQF